MPDSHDSTSPPGSRAWRRGCRCHACHVAEGRRRHHDLTTFDTIPVRVHGRRYTVADRLAIGTLIGAPGGLAVAAEIRAWVSCQLTRAMAATTRELHDRMAAEQARLEDQPRPAEQPRPVQQPRLEERGSPV